MSYGPLNENTRYLHEVFIGSDTDDIVTTAEATRAEADADAMIESVLGATFSEAGDPAAYPQIIINIAEMLGSAYLYHYIHSVHTGEGGGEEGETPADVLESKAMELLQKIRDGEIFVMGADGEWVEDFGPTTSVSSATANEEQDEDVIFDIRAKPYQYKEPHNAYDEPAYDASEDDD